jgi:hypothetical protein
MVGAPKAPPVARRQTYVRRVTLKPWPEDCPPLEAGNFF